MGTLLNPGFPLFYKVDPAQRPPFVEMKRDVESVTLVFFFPVLPVAVRLELRTNGACDPMPANHLRLAPSAGLIISLGSSVGPVNVYLEGRYSVLNGARNN